MEEDFVQDGVIYRPRGDGTVVVVGYQDAPQPQQGLRTTAPRLPSPQTPVQAQRDAVELGNATQRPREQQFDRASKLRSDFEASPSVKKYSAFLDAYIPSVQNVGTPGSDLALVYAYAKVMDPDSAVREGEAAGIAGGDTLYGRTVAEVSKNLDGQGNFRPEYRRQLLREMAVRGDSYGRQYNRERERYTQTAQRYDVNPVDVIGEHVGVPFRGIDRQFWDNQPGYISRSTLNERQRNQEQRPDPMRIGIEGSTDLSLGGPGRPLGPGEAVRFGDAPAEPERFRLTEGAQQAITQALRTGDVGQAEALFRQATGAQPDRAALQAAAQRLRENPNLPIQFDYSGPDQQAQDIYDRERYGNNLPDALTARAEADGDPTLRAIANAGSLGTANWLQAGIDTLGGQGDGQGFGDRFTDNLQRQRAIDEADRRFSPREVIGGSIAGSLINPVNRFTGGAGAMARNNAIAGGVQGALDAQTLGDVVPRTLTYAGAGGLGGAVGGSLAQPAARALTPTITPELRTLINEGVQLTPGQILGQGGAAGQAVKRVEDIVANAAVVGAPARAAQQRGNESFNRSVLNRILRNVGERLPDDVRLGHDAIRYVGDRLSQGYTQVLPRLSGTRDAGFDRRLNAIFGRARIPPDSAEGQNALRNLQTEISNAFDPNTGAYTGRSLRDVSERLSDLSSGWRASDDPYVRMAGETAARARDQLHGLARRQNAPEDAAALRNLDRGYAGLVRAERAVLNTDDGIIQPGRYNSAVRQADSSSRKRAVARGQAFDQDLASAASRVMGNTAAMGGSKDVNALMGLGAAATGIATGQPWAYGLAAGFGANAALGSRLGQDLARSAVMGAGPALPGVAANAARGAVMPLTEQEYQEYMRRNGGF